MTPFHVQVRVLPRAAILDPQGKAVGEALRSLGFGELSDVHVGRLITLQVQADDAEDARARAQSMCERLLANPITEDYVIDVLGNGAAG